MDMEIQHYDAVSLFSGGLDSILASKLIVEQGLKVKCLHFVSPFFGKPRLVKHWRAIYGLDIEAVDVSEAFADLLARRPRYGFGKVLNPCVDCKILMISHARRLMDRYGASFIISGEVLGQRPMSQRRDSLNVVRRDAEAKDVLLRPLCAKLLEPIPAEECGLVDRSRLLGISGRGRKEQLQLAAHYGITEIPTPAGGCKLTERENARSYWPVLQYAPMVTAGEFRLANTGRQYWAGSHWLAIGRNQGDNEYLVKNAFDGDLHFKVVGYPGPLAIGRQFEGAAWTPETVADAAAFVASFSPKAVRSGQEVDVRVGCGDEHYFVHVRPNRTTPLAWGERAWPEIREEIRGEARERLELASQRNAQGKKQAGAVSVHDESLDIDNDEAVE